MSYCNGTSDTWVLCAQDDHPETIVIPDPCSCPTATAARTMTLAQSSRINNAASLPSATGLSIAFQPGYYPSLVAPAPAPSTTPSSPSAPSSSGIDAGEASSQPGAASATALPTAAATEPPAQPSGSRLSNSATIGTAVSAAVFGLLVAAGLFWFLIVLPRRRRRHKALDKGNDEATVSPPPPPPGGALSRDADAVRHHNGNTSRSSSGSNSNPRSADDVATIGVAYGGARAYEDVSMLSSPHPSELDGKAARPWSLVSELDGGGVVGSRPGSMMTVVGSPSRMEAILERGQGGGGRGPYHGDCYGDGQAQGHSQGYGYESYRHRGHSASHHGWGRGGARPSELPADSIAELSG